MSKKNVFLFLAGGKINRPGQLAPGGEDNQGGGKISRDILPPGGQAVQGGKINCYTGIKVTHQMFQCTCTYSGGHQAVKFNKLDAHHLNALSALCMHDYIIYVGHNN